MIYRPHQRLGFTKINRESYSIWLSRDEEPPEVEPWGMTEVWEDEDDKASIWKSELWELVREILSPREIKILTFRFVQQLTLEESGDACDVTRERIRQIEAKALRKLRRVVCQRRIEPPWLR